MTMSRTLRSKLPSNHQMLKLPAVVNATSSLRARQARYKHTYDRSAKPLAPLKAGDVVRYRRGKVWEPAVVKPATGLPRSFKILHENGEFGATANTWCWHQRSHRFFSMYLNHVSQTIRNHLPPVQLRSWCHHHLRHQSMTLWFRPFLNQELTAPPRLLINIGISFCTDEDLATTSLMWHPKILCLYIWSLVFKGLLWKFEICRILYCADEI